MSSTISTTVTTGFTPSGYFWSLTITSAGAIITTGGIAVNASTYSSQSGSGSYGTLVNDGLIQTGGTSYAVWLDKAPVVTNVGTVIGGGGFTIADGGTFRNLGTIIGSSGEGVHAYHGGYIGNTGLISAAATGIYAEFGSVTNHGTIIGSIGVSTADAPLTNTGSIAGSSTGVVLGGYLTNSATGTITGGLTGIYANFGSVVNSGDVYGGLNGIALGTSSSGGFFTSGGFAFVDNTGSIGGAIDGILAPSGSTYLYVDNAGTITGGVDAVYAGGTTRLDLTVAPGAVFNGAVVDHAGVGTLALGSGGTGSLNMASFSDFSVLEFGVGAQWTLEGSTAQLADGEPIWGFQSGDTIILDGISASSASFVTGAGLELSGKTLSLATQFTGESFALSAGGGNTTIVATGPTHGLVSIISSAFFLPVTAGVGNYAADLTISNTGTLAAGLRVNTLDAGITVTNDGLILGSAELFPVGYAGGDVFVNNGIAGGVDVRGGTIVNTGTIAGYTGLWSGLLYNSGLITGGVGGKLGGAIVNRGVILGGISRADGLTVDPGASFGGSVDMFGGLTLAGSGTGSLDMGGTFNSVSNITFGAGVDWSLEGTASELADGQTITGFAVGDTLVLDGFAATSKIYAAGAELVLLGSSGNATLDIIGSFSTSEFLVTDNAQGGTNISVLCYLRGTRLLAPEGERPVEGLRIGDALVTRGGVRPIKWIGRQSFSPVFAGRHKTPVRIAAGALGAGLPWRDLFVSPGHSVLLGGQLVLARNLVNGVNITQSPASVAIEYFLIEFETHDCVLAEGVWAESFADGPGLRGQFHNAAAFYAAYPDYVTPEVLTLCAPRPEHGKDLAAALAPVVARAGAGLVPGPLRGFIDVCGPDHVEGWAQDEAHPELPVELHIIDGTVSLGTILACDYRADLANAGLGSGHCHFKFQLERPVRNFIRVIRAGDGAEIFVTHDCARVA